MDVTRLFSAARAGAVLGLLVLAGCFWPTPGQGPNRQAHNDQETAIGVDTVASLGLAWEAQVDEGAVGDPVTSGRAVHVKDARAVYGFAPATGARRWRYGVTAPETMDQPLVHGDRVHANMVIEPTPDRPHGATVELDPATGAVLDGPDGLRPVAFRGDRVLRFTDVRHFSLSVWLYFFTVADTATGETPCCAGLFFSGSVNRELPRFTLGSDWVLHSGVGFLADLPPGDPAAMGNAVRGYAIEGTAVCEQFTTYACPTWATPTDGTTTTVPVLADDEATTYVGTDAGTVYAVDTATGAIRWTAALGSAVTDAPALAGGALYVPTAAGDLVVLAADGCGAATCAPVWSASTGSAITQQPAVAGGVVFTGSADGSLQAFAAAGCGAVTCPALWSDSTGSAITGAPAVSQGRLYAGTADGRLVAYALPSTPPDPG